MVEPTRFHKTSIFDTDLEFTLTILTSQPYRTPNSGLNDFSDTDVDLEMHYSCHPLHLVKPDLPTRPPPALLPAHPHTCIT